MINYSIVNHKTKLKIFRFIETTITKQFLVINIWIRHCINQNKFWFDYLYFAYKGSKATNLNWRISNFQYVH